MDDFIPGNQAERAHRHLERHAAAAHRHCVRHSDELRKLLLKPLVSQAAAICHVPSASFKHFRDCLDFVSEDPRIDAKSITQESFPEADDKVVRGRVQLAKTQYERNQSIEHEKGGPPSRTTRVSAMNRVRFRVEGLRRQAVEGKQAFR